MCCWGLGHKRTTAWDFSTFFSLLNPTQVKIVFYGSGGYLLFVKQKNFGGSRGGGCSDEKENKIFLIYKKIQKGVVAKSYMTKGYD
jgi:hypothetical protein